MSDRYNKPTLSRREAKQNEQLDKLLDEYLPVPCMDNCCRVDQAMCVPCVYLLVPWLFCFPLHHASMCGCSPVVDCMVTKHRGCCSCIYIDPNQKMPCWFDSEPLGWAASWGHLDTVITLIVNGADPLLPPNKAGFTPQRDARRERHDHVVKFLEAYERIMSLSPALQQPGDRKKLQESEAMQSWLSEKLRSEPAGGPRSDQGREYPWFESQGWASRWPLHQAALLGDVNKITSLISEQSRDPNEKMTVWFDSEPLGWASSLGHLHAVITLIKLGADPLLPANKAGYTTKSDAQRERHQHVIRFLKEFVDKMEELADEEEEGGYGTMAGQYIKPSAPQQMDMNTNF